jgi:voltage-gated potassium channel
MSNDANRRAATPAETFTPRLGAVDSWRFALVLISSLAVAIGQPLAAGLLDEQGTFDIAVSLMIVAVTLLAFDQPKHRRMGLLLGIAAFIGLGIAHSVSGPASRKFLAAAYLLTALYFTFAWFGIVRMILVGRVSTHAILGAVCGYLLLGIVWSLLYTAVETVAPQSFRIAGAGGGESAPFDRGTLSYYSFVTLSTVGYGDVTPATPLARTLSWTEAVAGQLYLAVLVAGLVGFRVSQGPPKSTESAASHGATY